MSTNKFFIVIGISIILNLGVGSTKILAEQEPSLLLSNTDTNTTNKIDRGTLFLKAKYLHHDGKHYKALQAYDTLFKLDGPDWLQKDRFELLSQMGKDDEIVKKISQTGDLFEKDIKVQLIKFQSLLNTNNHVEAKKVLEKLMVDNPNNEKITLYAAEYYGKTNEPQKAIGIIDKHLAKYPRRKKNFLMYFLKAQSLLKLNQPEKALTSINKSIKIVPSFDKAILFKALLLQKMGKINSAIQAYQDFLQHAGYNPAVIKQLVHLLFSQKKFAQAAEYFKKMEAHTKLKHPRKSLPAEFYFDLGLLQYKAGKKNIALTYAKKALRKNPNFRQAQILIIDVLLESKKQDALISQAEKWLSKNPENNLIVYKLLLLTKQTLSTQKVNTQKVISSLENVHQKHPTSHNISLAIADLSMKTKQYYKAMAFYKTTYANTNDEELKAKLLFQEAFILVNKKTPTPKQDAQKALEILKRAEDQKIVYISSLHLQAQCLMILEKFDEAHSYIDQVLVNQKKISPELRARILDTKGLIYEKEKKYDLAKKTFTKALALAPNDKIIEKHLTHAKTK